jgi:Transposase DDE domain group 1
MSDITEEALNTIEKSFGPRFVRHAPGEVEPHAEQPFGSVLQESAEEVESLMKLASCWLMDALRRKLIERGMRRIQLDTLRLRLVKIGERVRELLTKIRLHLAAGHPGRSL